ncbi:FAD/NAD(P)-binding protein [Spirulina subsalsa]|uniref:FAD/NAD(P)-binding protein n=1 Tax=Spirulina subsalsa TaxID=54311 RepID=UPI0003758886|nr:FAD/NAD(P)-binding protein [Spirulina subsalsa]
MTRPLDIAIIGAGPHGLMLATHLLKKRPKWRSRLKIFDPSGQWLKVWQQQFEALDIPYLRSPAVHHPDPNPYALRHFAETRPEHFYPPYDRPSRELFQQFCQDVIKRWQLEEQVIPQKIEAIEPLKGRKSSLYQLHSGSGESVIARRVVLATGPSVPQWPSWAENHRGERLCSAQEVDLRGLSLRGEQVVIVGGGLTAGHLAVGATTRGATVTLIHRRKMQVKLFDADPSWLGPKSLKTFWEERDWETRWQMIQSARNGGSLTPEMMTQLRQAQKQGLLQLRENCQIVDLVESGQQWQITCDDGQTLKCDRLWCATGTQWDVAQHPLLKTLQDFAPLPLIRGLPVLDDHLRWGKSNIFVMGGWAALQLGPVARNLSGGRMACDRIVPALIKPSLYS